MAQATSALKESPSADVYQAGHFSAAGPAPRALFAARLRFRVESILRAYGAAFLLVMVALAVTWTTRHYFPYPFLFLFFAAVMVSAWIGGNGAGLFAVFLSTAAVDYYFEGPIHSFAINRTDSVYFAAFVACSVAASWISSSKRKSEQALLEARDHLEARVAERTAALRQVNAKLRSSIEARDKAQQDLMKTQAELAHLSRVFTMGELTSSIAHEVNQPLTAVVTYGHACLEWLSADPPNLAEAREAAQQVISDGSRAGAVLGRIRSLFKKQTLARDWVNINELIDETTASLAGQAATSGVILRKELDARLPEVLGDRVQLQQVLLNLILNGLEAMDAVSNRAKEIVIRSKVQGSEVLVAVEDSGAGIKSEITDRIFHPFFTTKAQGIGMGLSISRSILESHAGHLWAETRASGGAVFQFTLPIGLDDGSRER